MKCLNFTQKEVAKIVDLSSNTLQGWARDGLIVPSIANPKGRGNKRLYSLQDIYLIATAKLLSQLACNRDFIKYFIANLDLSNSIASIEYSNGAEVKINLDNIKKNLKMEIRKGVGNA